MNVSIRPYEDSDLESIIEVLLRGWESSGVPYSSPHDAGTLRSKIPRGIERGLAIYVAVFNALVVGFIFLNGEKLDQLYVDPNYQRRGVGRKLIEFVKGIRPSGFWLTAIAASHDARRFYEREGLRPICMEIDLGIEVMRYEWTPVRPQTAYNEA